MAEFKTAYEKTLINEGGYELHSIPGDLGGLTFAGISRRYHENWPGWILIDNKEFDKDELKYLCKDFYHSHFWQLIMGNEIKYQSVADSIYDFAVNAGVKTATKLAQVVTPCDADGFFGPSTLEAINKTPPEHFQVNYTLAKISRYVEIVNKNRKQEKFLLGWLNRCMKGAI